MNSSHRDPSTKTTRLSRWGKSLLNKLSADTRANRKRAADKKRRQAAKRDINTALDD